MYWSEQRDWVVKHIRDNGVDSAVAAIMQPKLDISIDIQLAKLLPPMVLEKIKLVGSDKT